MIEKQVERDRVSILHLTAKSIPDPTRETDMNPVLKKPAAIVVFPIIAFSLVSCFHRVAEADLNDLLKQVPSSANSIVLINASAIAANASGESRDQIKEHLEAAKAWPLVSAWKPQQIVIASELDIQHMAPTWGMAAIAFAEKPDIEEIAKKANGIVDHLAGHDVIWLEQACILVTGEKQLTIVSPLNRQSAANWLRRMKRQDSIALSPYLADVAKSFESGDSEIIVALDLENVFSPTQISTAISNSPLFKKIKTNPTDLISSIRGLTIHCQVDANQDSSISFDFGKPIASIEPIARELMIGSLTKAGAMLGEFDRWKSEDSGNRISMHGKLSASGLRRILGISSISSIMAHAETAAPSQPAVKPDTEQAEAADPADQAKRDATANRYEQARIRNATKSYFQKVQTALNDVFDNQDQNSLDQAALWVNNSASAINRLSTRDVDPELVKYGRYAANSLSDIVGQLHQSDMTRRNRQQAVVPRLGNTEVTAVPYRRINYGGNVRYRYAPMVTTQLDLGAGLEERRTIRAEEVGNANQLAWSIKTEIDQESTSIRQYLTKKYGIEF